MRRFYIIAAILFFSFSLVEAQERPDSLSIKDEAYKEDIIHGMIMKMVPSRFLPMTVSGSYPQFDMQPTLALMEIISRNVINSRLRWHLTADQNRFFLSGMQPGLFPDVKIAPAHEFDNSIFLDPNFDQRVYAPGSVYNKGVNLPQSVFQNKSVFRKGYNPTDKVNW